MVELAVTAEVLGRAAAPGPWYHRGGGRGGGRVRGSRVGQGTAAPPGRRERAGHVGRSRRRTRRQGGALGGTDRSGWSRRHAVGVGLARSAARRGHRYLGAGSGGHRRRRALGRCGAGTRGRGRAVAQFRSLPPVGPMDPRRGSGARRSRTGPGGHCSHPGPVPGGLLGRGGRRGPLVPRHRRRARPDPPTVRPAHRPVPGGSSTGWPTCSCRWSRRWPPPGTRPLDHQPPCCDPGPGVRTRPPRRATQASGLAVQLAASLALDGYVEAAKGAIQVLGGMGFTWEHDAHIHLRRSTTLRQTRRGNGPAPGRGGPAGPGRLASEPRHRAASRSRAPA